MALSYVGVIGYENVLLADGVTLTVPDSAAWSRPISNILNDKFISKTARCSAVTDLTKTQFLIDYHRARKLSMVSLYALTVSLDSRVKLTALDAELLTNPGRPFAAVTGWTATSGGASLSVVASRLRVTSATGAEAGRAHVATLPGELYLLDIDAGAVSGGTGFVAVGSAIGSRDIRPNSALVASKRNSFVFTATGTDAYIYLGNLTSGQSADFDAASCRTIERQVDWMDIHPRIYSTADLDFEDDNWWTGKPTPKDLATYGNNLIYLPDEGWSASALKIEIDDSSNPAGEFDIGFGFTAARITPPFNYIVGSNQSLIYRTVSDETPSGREVVDRRKSRRTHSVAWDMLPKSFAMRLLDMGVRNDQVDPVLFVPTPNDPKNIFREAFLGKIAAPPNIGTIPVPDLRKVELQITEKVA